MRFPRLVKERLQNMSVSYRLIAPQYTLSSWYYLIYLILKLVRNFFKSGLEKASVVRRLDNAIHWINCHTAERIECFVNTYQLVSNLSGGKRYPAFEKPRPEVQFLHTEIIFIARQCVQNLGCVLFGSTVSGLLWELKSPEVTLSRINLP